MRVKLSDLAKMTPEERDKTLAALVEAAMRPAAHVCAKCGKPSREDGICTFCRRD